MQYCASKTDKLSVNIEHVYQPVVTTEPYHESKDIKVLQYH